MNWKVFGIAMLLFFSVTTASAAFVEMGAGARPVAMAEAFTALADDASAMLLNPAGLNLINDIEIIGVYLDQSTTLEFGGISSGMIGIAIPLSGNYYFGFSGYLQKTELPEGYDTPQEYYFSLSLATNISKLLIGFTYRNYTNDSSSEETPNGSDFDLGLMYPITANIRFGYLFQNMKGVDLGTSFAPDFLTRNHRIGLLYQRHVGFMDWNLTANYNMDDFREDYWDYKYITAGTECWLFERMFAFRVGYHRETSKLDAETPQVEKITFGIGVRYKFLQFDYAYKTDTGKNATDLTDSKVSLILRLKSKVKATTTNATVN